MMTEIFEDYAALQRGSEPDVAVPRVLYRDFVALEKRAIASAEARGFWSKLIENANLQPLPRWPKSQCAGGHEQMRGPEIVIDPDILSRLIALARTAGVPLKTVLLAAHLRVSALLQAQSDVTTGLLWHGRPEVVDGEKMLGLFLNTLPIRVRIENGSWLDLVKQTFAAEQQIVPHRNYPLAEIHKLNGGRPLFEAAFDFVHFHVYNRLAEHAGLDFREGHYFEANNLTAFTTFMLDAASTRLELHIDYDPNALCRRQIEELSAYYVNTLRAMAAYPTWRQDVFSPLSAEEKDRLLAQWNATEEPYPREARLHELFEARVLEAPDDVAVAFEDTTLTYGELDARANALAERLRQFQVGPNVLVGIYLERSPEMMVGLLGILKAGGAYVPLDPAFPKDRLAFMLEDAKVRVLLTERKWAATLPTTDAPILCLDGPDEAPSAEDASPVEAPAGRSTDLAYVIYTSGSTGKPKGVQVIHQAVVNLLVSAGKTIQWTPSDNLLAVTTLSFDIAALELFLPLISGGRLTLASREDASDGTRLAALIRSSEATVMQATPATWRLLIESGWNGGENLRILCGGEALSRELADELLARAREVWNFYGPTETTIWSTAWKVTPGESILIGRPLANTRLYILDPNLQPVPVGAAGELHIGGDGLARGYLRRPELDAAKFITLRIGIQPDARVYKTGDLARFLPDGRVECLGRNDQQVKIRGFRVELGEIETVLRQHPGIADAYVTARADGSGENRLAAYLVTKNGPLGVAELRDFVRSKLPHYMVPAHFVTLAEFPRTPNGKMDARRLPPPESNAEKSTEHVAPRDETEQTLAAIWCEVLEVKQVGINDDFFELGGDSLSATRAFARINKRFGSDLTLRTIFDRPTITALAISVRESRGRAAARPEIKPRQSRRIKLPQGV